MDSEIIVKVLGINIIHVTRTSAKRSTKAYNKTRGNQMSSICESSQETRFTFVVQLLATIYVLDDLKSDRRMSDQNGRTLQYLYIAEYSSSRDTSNLSVLSY